MGSQVKAVGVDKAAIKARLAEPKRAVKETELRGVKKVYDRNVTFTSDLAVQYLELEPVAYEREVRDAWVAELASRMANALFQPEYVNINIAICLWDGKVRRLNGQHTCWARLELPASWKKKVRVVKYEVKTEDDYRVLYVQNDDIAIRTRGHKDVVIIFGTPEYSDVPAYACRSLMQGFAFWQAPWRRMTSKEQGDKLRSKFAKTGSRVAGLISVVKELAATHLRRRQGAYAAMFETVELATEQAVVFWKQVISGLNFKSHRDPAKVLHSYLTGVAVNGSGRNKRPVTAGHMYNVCVECFNAWRAGKLLTKTPAGKRDHRSRAR